MRGFRLFMCTSPYLPSRRLGIAAALVLFGESVGSAWIVLVLAIAAAVAERGSVRVTDTTELSISPVLMLFAAVLWGPWLEALSVLRQNSATVNFWTTGERQVDRHD